MTFYHQFRTFVTTLAEIPCSLLFLVSNDILEAKSFQYVVSNHAFYKKFFLERQGKRNIVIVDFMTIFS